MSAASLLNGRSAEHLQSPRDQLPSPGNAGPGAPALAGLVPFSGVDWPGKLAAVIFIAGCPWRCGYCHNPHLQQRHAVYSWPAVMDWLHSRQGLLDGVVFSGGEPLSEAQLPAMVNEARSAGFQVGLHTAGIYPQRLRALLPLLDWVGLDIKHGVDGYDALTGRSGSHVPAMQSLQALLEHGGEFECRTTWSPQWQGEVDLLALATTLARQGVRNYAVQLHRAGPSGPAAMPLSAATASRLGQLFQCFAMR
ncbi:anaerobic ribonucleoside-triphosphate reductase activating protein [Andreprevotia lacus DSM 23236]|jgi:pyruvate formate lyase activating enzyme|uniref:Anaerobic ribonucleoside-triphosphate reductase activating protein n=1 Tax=Andreprevotia lacus DSM 23236 TaxID=1121001 RepID=A0A1W1XX09_9NEIS|nr:anaerobic ribonucleoside-triphosphate reductase activating protein [Andreprevotia lacus]SMC28466.1 anaerobic ribonucleoside-triphosphate reductase activating protein [Andreprevotia lacus DSM 23236]